MSNRIQDLIIVGKERKELKREIVILRYIIMVLVIIIAILTVIVIGDFVIIWGGAMINDPNLELGIINIYI